MSGGGLRTFRLGSARDCLTGAFEGSMNLGPLQQFIGNFNDTPQM
jgi:hypothetical protein